MFVQRSHSREIVRRTTLRRYPMMRVETWMHLDTRTDFFQTVTADGQDLSSGSGDLSCCLLCRCARGRDYGSSTTGRNFLHFQSKSGQKVHSDLWLVFLSTKTLK
jgi:hypothetical protein